MSSPSISSSLEQRRRALAEQLASVGDLRPGSLGQRFRRCGKPNCRCADPADPGHGPSWSLTWAEHGTTRSRQIPDGPPVERTQAQIAEYHRFKKLVREFLDTSQRLCDATLDASARDSSGLEEKKGSTPSSRRKSSKRSKGS
jgi:hypothetical protein